MNSGQLITACLIILLISTPLHAARYADHSLLMAQSGHSSNGGGITLEQAVAQARQQHQGKVLSANTAHINGRKVYRIKILTKNGRVKRTQIDAHSGRMQSRGQ